MDLRETKRLIASVELYEVKDFSGSILQKGGVRKWLGWDARENRPAFVVPRNHAQSFALASDIYDRAPKWDGCVWYHRMVPGTLEIYRETVTTSVVLEKITEGGCYS